MAKLKEYWYTFALWACRMFCVVFFRMHIDGSDNVPGKGPFLLICNHQSYLDPLFCGSPSRRQLAFVARDTLFKSWFFGNLIASVGTIPIKRDKSDLGAVKKMLRTLQDGKGLCLFPEGTRSQDGKISALKPGFGFICRKTKAPIVPVVVDGAFECWPRFAKFFSPGHDISVSYGQSISPQEIENMDDKQLARYLTNILRDLQNNARIKRKKQPFKYQKLKIV